MLNRRPVLVALAGPNGAGKTTFYHAHLQPAGLRLVNADLVARELAIDAYEAAEITSALRAQLIAQHESFVFETVFSDPVGDKIAFLKQATSEGYTVILCFIGLASADLSNERVAMRISQGGHDVPLEKVYSRFPRVLRNLKIALRELPDVRIYDNSDLENPYRLVAVCDHGKPAKIYPPVPKWLQPILPKS
jgi:predicted ABC-type ATPase